MVEYIEQNPEQSMMFVAQNIKRTLDNAINLTPFYVKKIQDEIDNEKGNGKQKQKQKQKNMKIIHDLNEKKEISIRLNERIQKISFG